MPANSMKRGAALWILLPALALLVSMTLAATPVAAGQVAERFRAFDEGRGTLDRGTDDGDEAEPESPNSQSPSEDDTQQEAGPESPDFRGCIFEKRDLGLLV